MKITLKIDNIKMNITNTSIKRVLELYAMAELNNQIVIVEYNL